MSRARYTSPLSHAGHTIANTLHFRRRWAPWWLALIAAVCSTPLVYLYLIDLPTRANWRPTTEIRIIGAALAVAAYWILGVIANWSIAVVKPAGVRLSMLPFPTGSGQFVRRESIIHCYARHRIETDDTNSYVTEDYYAIGVETTRGHQLDIHLPYATEGEALTAAHEIARVLNLSPAGRLIEVRPVATVLTYPTFWGPALLWSAITILAVFIGWRWA